MKKDIKEKEVTLSELFDLCIEKELASPNDVDTERPVRYNGHFSLLKKLDGSYSIKDELTQKEYGHFQTEEEAMSEWNEIKIIGADVLV